MSRSGYAYVLVGIIALLAVGWRNSISMFYQHLMSFYGIESVTQVAAFVAISSGVGVLASSVFGVLYDRKGPSAPLLVGSLAQLASGALVLLMKGRPWDEAVWYWYASAAASGFVFPSVSVTVNPTVIRSVPTKPQLALAVAQSGSYLSLALWSPAVAYLIARTDPFYTYMVASLVTALVTSTCALSYRGIHPLRRRTEEAGTDPGSRRAYLLVLPLIFLVATSSIVLISFLAPIITEVCESSGIPREEAVSVYTPAVMGTAGVLQTAGGLFWGLLSTRLGILRTVVALYSVQSASSLIVAASSGAYPWLALSALLLRLFAFGGEPVVHMSIVPAIFGGSGVGRAIGQQISVVMLSSILGPTLGGLIRDATRTYLAVVSVSAALTALALVSLLPVSRHLSPLNRQRAR